MVSGLPAAKRNAQLIGMLQGFFDGSTQDSEVLVVGGYVSTVDRWLAFTDAWQALLDENHGRPFKMVRAAKSVRGMRRARAHFEVADDHTLAGVCCAIPIEPLGRIVDELKLPDDFRNPYFIAWRSILSICTHYLKIAEPIDFVFDDQTEKYSVLRSWDHYLATAPRTTRKKIAGVPSFKDDTKVLPLQAADLIAWWGRRQFLNGEIQSRVLFPPEWTAGRREKLFYFHIPEGGIRESFLQDIALTEKRKATIVAGVTYTPQTPWAHRW